MLYQADVGGELHVLKKGKPEWKVQNAPVPKKAQMIHRKYAERVEDNWNDPFWEAHHSDMMDGEYVLHPDEEHPTIFAILDNTASIFNGKIIYELDESDTKRFLVQLRLKYSARNKLQTMLEKEFGGEDAMEKFKSFCAAVQVEVQDQE